MFELARLLQSPSLARRFKPSACQREAATQLRIMIARFEQEIASLDVGIGTELELARVRKPSHFAYPISARTLDARRENLKATVAALIDRLALSEDEKLLLLTQERPNL